MEEVREFSSVLKAYVRRRGDKQLLCKKTANLGCPISPRSIQRYMLSEVVPSFKYAKAIVQALDIPFSDDDIRLSLEAEKVLKDNLNSLDINFKREVTLNFRRFSDKQGMMERIEQRAKELFPNSANCLSDYFLELAREDLNKEGI